MRRYERPRRKLVGHTTRKVLKIICCGILVHILVLQAAFDIYFSSPIDQGMSQTRSTEHPPAKRVVLIIADGLRAESVFGVNQTWNAPYLNALRKERGSWGISHTRVPTESRPGHVAILGGIYEDPSAILKGWRVNPVDFDSVINQSTNAWCWGGPSIIKMFNKDNSSHIRLYSYDSKMEDFGNNDTIALDSWVFDHVTEFLSGDFEPDTTFEDIKKDGNIFFLHLLGIDTAGHGFKPYSKGYIDNIKFVDKHVLRLERVFETIFHDDSTAYIFTSDHGMTDWGSHGSGSDHETSTPFIAWGAGIKNDPERKDVDQIDIAPLIAALIGINYPINSIGRLPHPYLNVSIDVLSELIFSNVVQHLEILNVKMSKRMRNAFNFVPFRGADMRDVENMFLEFQQLKKNGPYNEFKFEAGSLMNFIVDAIDYYHNYYQLPILTAMSIGLVCWIVFLITVNINVKVDLFRSHRIHYLPFFMFGPLYFNAILFVYLQQLPLMYYLYFMFPLFMVQVVTNRGRFIIASLRLLKEFGVCRSLIHALIYLTGFRLLVQGFQNRSTFSFVLFLISTSIWWSRQLNDMIPRFNKIVFVVLCVVLSFFSFSPVMATEFEPYSFAAGYFLFYGCFEMYFLNQIEDDRKNIILRIQFAMFKITPIYTMCVDTGYIAPDSPLKDLAVIWALIPVLLIPYSPNLVLTRLNSIFLGFAPFYLMVSTNSEVLFITCYIGMLHCWLSMESKCFGYATIRKKTFIREIQQEKNLCADDFRRAFFFMALIFMGFFGTGNIANLNSFDPMWVRCFLTVFSPFKMSAIILLRISIPFIYTTCVFRAVNLCRRANTLNMFCIVLMFSDMMLLELLYFITNVGSWLQIGLSLSQFVIMEAFVIILIILYGIGNILTTLSMFYGIIPITW